MTAFIDYDVDTAPEASRPALAAAARRFGRVPSPLARMAASPLVLAAVDATFALWARVSLTSLEREVVVMTVARENGCAWCVAMHTSILESMGAGPDLIAALRTGAPLADARLASLARLTAGAMAARGAVDDAVMTDFVAAGFTPAQALEVVLGIAVFTLTTYANRLTRAPLDATVT